MSCSAQGDSRIYKTPYLCERSAELSMIHCKLQGAFIEVEKLCTGYIGEHHKETRL